MKLSFDNKVHECRDDETVLEAFLRRGVVTPFSCRNGVCHTCLLRAVDAPPPKSSQRGIKATLIDKGYFLPCICKPEADMKIEPPRAADILTRAVVYKKELLSPNVCRLLLEPATQIYYRAGQFINIQATNIQTENNLIRSYSLASVPHDDYYMEMHVRRVPKGKMSQWIFDELQENDELELQGPLGRCYYMPDDINRNILLISTGTGVAPHIGIVKDALLTGHQGKIKLYHGVKKQEDHYLCDNLETLARKYSNFSYVLCASDDKASSAVSGRCDEIALQQNTNIQDWRVYLSGHPQMIVAAEKAMACAGVNKEDIYSDPFLYDNMHADEALSKELSTDQLFAEAEPEPRKFPDPDPEMWQALNNGALMTEILTDFYTQVFDDELLSPYFKGITKQRLIEKVYNFHYQMFTGEKVYFGDQPKNTHHWMVISDEMFDYRESIMENCLREHGLAEHLIKRWMQYEEMYRPDIVKSTPIKKILFGEEVPLDGFEEIEIGASTLCDSCAGEINVGDLVRYHIRMGTTYCGQCMNNCAQLANEEASP
ncbi:2-polyprenylphenol hydroxylase and related flavodoxin oxidoreductases / CDP-6-deoxy-delta-3,4-glucoseen reductase-like [hydrothermal vent metagenome]|uniref:2-polyprenylphenol hydroxylase and related flavodoxin oxidoreductases / CDP-6-deoxy-delta-3,4-glucoseen reductase-like n=1 Tax=hydrothermal vent metagenome TaxID=652676 RepID=A0A3B0X635_9ZZZZ